MFIYVYPSGPLLTNAILVGCEKSKKGAVIDPAPDSARTLLKKAEEEGIQIEKILLTHSHWDHFADAKRVQEATGAPIYVHPLDQKNIEKPGSDNLPLMIEISPVKAQHNYDDGDQVTVGELVFEVIHSPGHSPGGVCLYCRQENLLISGDTLFKGGMGNLSLPTSEPEKMPNSLKKLSQLPPNTRVIPGHQGETTIGKEGWIKKE